MNWCWMVARSVRDNGFGRKPTKVFFLKIEEGKFDGNVPPATIVYIHLLVPFVNVHRNLIL